MPKIIYTSHARSRMRQRRITQGMVKMTLANPDHPYRRGNVADEEIAERRFRDRVIQVVFEERKTRELVVITAKTLRVRSR